MCTQNMTRYMTRIIIHVYWSEHSHWYAVELHPIRFAWDAKIFTIPLSAAIQKVFANEFTLI